MKTGKLIYVAGYIIMHNHACTKMYIHNYVDSNVHVSCVLKIIVPCMQDTHQNDNIREESTDDDHGDESVHDDDVGSCYKAMYYYEIFYVQSTHPVPPKLNYMELQLAS